VNKNYVNQKYVNHVNIFNKLDISFEKDMRESVLYELVLCEIITNIFLLKKYFWLRKNLFVAQIFWVHRFFLNYFSF
jgi:hypothetical protein